MQYQFAEQVLCKLAPFLRLGEIWTTLANFKPPASN